MSRWRSHPAAPTSLSSAMMSSMRSWSTMMGMGLPKSRTSSVSRRKSAIPTPSSITLARSPRSRVPIGIRSSASRRKAIVLEGNGDFDESGPWVQVSRLAEPLINEVIIPMGKKDYWNSQQPAKDSQFVQYYAHPELQTLLPVLYPGVFPHLAAYSKARVDLEAILLTGIPAGIISGFQNFTGKTQADLLRLNMAIAPAKNPNILGVIGGDLAGFPNGRRVFD